MPDASLLAADLAASLLVAGLAGWILWLGPRHVVHRAFAAFLLCDAALHAFAALDADVGTAVDQARLLAATLFPAAAANLWITVRHAARIERGTAGWGVKAARWGAGALAVAGPGLLLAAPQWFEGPPFLAELMVGPAVGFVLALLAACFAFAHWRPPADSSASLGRAGFVHLALGLLFIPFSKVVQAAFLGPALLSDEDRAFNALQTSLTVGSLLLALGAAALLVAAAYRRPANGRRRVLLAVAFCVALPVAIHGLPPLLRDGPSYGLALAALRMAGLMWLVAFCSFAILRHRLFGLDGRMRSLLGRAMVLGAFVAAYLVGAAAAGLAFPGFSVLAGWVAAALLVVTLRPLDRMSQRVANFVLPGTVSGPEAADPVELYRTQVRMVLAAGTMHVSDRRLLDRLRDRLGVPAAWAARIEGEEWEAVKGRGRKVAAVPGPA